MAALDDDYPQYRPSLEDLARQEYERRQREQERYAPPGAPPPMAPSEYVVAQAPVPPPLRANEAPMGQDRRASPVSALDMQEPRMGAEDMAAYGQRPPERYVPQQGAVAPMYPSPPAEYGPIPGGDVATATIPPVPPVPVPMPPPGVSQATQDVLAAHGAEPQALPPPGPRPYRRADMRSGVSPATQDILADRAREDLTPAAPAKEGDIIWTAGEGLHRAKGGETGGISFGQLPSLPDVSDIGFDLEKGLYRKGSAVAVSSSTPETATTPKPVAEADIPPPTIKADTAPWKQKFEPRGAVGHPTSATGERPVPPPATPKATVDPYYLVKLEKTNPALHDMIIQAATAAGIGSGDYANLVYAASKADPNFNEGGRKGLAGLTDADIEKYQSGVYKQAFANADPMNPATNLLMGALKYADTRSDFGPRTQSSLLAYYLSPERVNELARHTPEQQRELIPEAARTFVKEGVSPDAPGSVPAHPITDAGSMTAAGAAQALNKAAQAGDPRIYYRYQNDTMPRGMTSNDGWRYAEGKLVGAFVAAGDMEGAQKARELIFQMSHVGTNQALMRAHSLLGAGDKVGAAKELALAYWATPDGGQATFHVTPQGIVGQRYNEATGQPTGAPFLMDQSRIMGLMNLTKDPMAYQKNVREGAKLAAEIADKEADAKYKTAQAADVSEKRQTAQDEITRRYVNDVLRSMKGTNASAASKDPAISHQIEQEFKDYYEIKDPLTNKILPSTPDLEAQGTMFKDMRFNSPRLAGVQARGIAKDLYDNPKGGAYKVVSGTGGVGWVVPRNNPNQAIAFLSPPIARLFIAPAAPPVIGGIPAPPAGR